MAEKAVCRIKIGVGEALQIANGYSQLDVSGSVIYLVPVVCKRIGLDVYLVPVGELADSRRVVTVFEQ